MARSTLENKDERSGSEKNHPVDASDLLALIRKQPFEKEAFVRQHLMECASCQQLYADLAQVSKTLDVLGQVARYQRYPELSAAYLLKNGRQGYSQRRFSRRRAARYEYNTIRPRSSTLRLAMPVAMVVILVMAFIFIALARFGWNGSLNAPGGGTNVNQSGLSTGVARQLPTLLPGASTTAVAGPYPRWRVKSVSTGARSESYIYACSTSQDAALHYLDICGRRFMPGHTVSLIVAYDSNAPRTAFTVLVSASGMFIYRWSLSSCKSGPLFVYAEDITSNPPRYSSNALVYLAVPGCANPIPRPAPWADK